MSLCILVNLISDIVADHNHICCNYSNCTSRILSQSFQCIAMVIITLVSHHQVSAVPPRYPRTDTPRLCLTWHSITPDAGVLAPCTLQHLAVTRTLPDSVHLHLIPSLLTTVTHSRPHYMDILSKTSITRCLCLAICG